jgi:hypothetical protein
MTGGIISPVRDLIGGSRGGRSLAEYFSRLSLATGTQIGEITRKPLYINSYSFVPYYPYVLEICASGLAFVFLKETGTYNTKIAALKIQRVDALEFLGEVPIVDFIAPDPTPIFAKDLIMIKRGDFLYILSNDLVNSKIAKIDVSNPADMKVINILSDAEMTDFSAMDYYNGYLLCTTKDTDPGKLHIINTDCDMSYLKAITDDTGLFRDIYSIHVQGKYSICSRNLAGQVGVFILDNTNIEFQYKMPKVGYNTFSLTFGLLPKGYIHNETAYYFASSRMTIVSIANKKIPQAIVEDFDIGSLGFSTVYGCVVFGRYMFITSVNFDALGTFDISDIASPELVDERIVDITHLNAVGDIKGWGQYVITVAASSSNGFAIWDVNGYAIPAAEIGSLIVQGKANFNDTVRIGEELVVEKNIYGKNMDLDGYIHADNTLRYALPIHNICELPPPHFIEKIGDQDNGSVVIENIGSTSGLAVNQLIEGDGIQSSTFIVDISPFGLEISKPATKTIDGNLYQIDGYIDLDDAPGIEFWIDTPLFLIPYWIKVSSVDSCAFGTKGESKYIYTSRGAAIRGTIALRKFFALLGKFFISHTESPDLAKLFDLNAILGQPATVFTENLVTFQSSAAYLNIGAMDRINLSQTVAQITTWAKGITCVDPYKLKPSKLSFSQGGNFVDAVCLNVSGNLANIADIAGFDFTPAVEGGNERFFYFDPTTIANTAAAGNQVLLIGNIMKGANDQYWAAGSATGADPGLKVLGCPPIPDSSVNCSVKLENNFVYTPFIAEQEWVLVYGANLWVSENVERMSVTSDGVAEYLGVNPTTLKTSGFITINAAAQTRNIILSLLCFDVNDIPIFFDPILDDTIFSNTFFDVNQALSFYYEPGVLPIGPPVTLRKESIYHIHSRFAGTPYGPYDYGYTLKYKKESTSFIPFIVNAYAELSIRPVKFHGIPQQENVGTIPTTMQMEGNIDIEKNKKIYMAINHRGAAPLQDMLVSTAYYGI